MPQEDDEAAELEHTQEVGLVIFSTADEAAEVVEPSEEALGGLGLFNRKQRTPLVRHPLDQHLNGSPSRASTQRKPPLTAYWRVCFIEGPSSARCGAEAAYSSDPRGSMLDVAC